MYRPERRKAGRLKSRKRGPYHLAGMTSCWAAGILTLAASASVSPALLVMAYPVVSFFVSRYLRGQLVYHRVYDTVENVSGAKLAMFLYWPVALPVLIFKLSIVRTL